VISRLNKFLKLIITKSNIKSVLLLMSARNRNNEDNDGGIKAFLVGLGLGAIGYAILSFLTKPRCPNCDRKIDRNVPQCPFCHVYLNWK
jgi:hypothetical protein